jgi:hypothetical protein
MSDTPLERKIYEDASRTEDAFLVDRLKETLAGMDRPPGWRRTYGRPGRPRKVSRRGPKTRFTWRRMAIVLALMALWGCGRRQARSRLAASPDLMARIGLTEPPSPRTIGRALDRFNETWLKQLNKRLLDSAKKGSEADRQTSHAELTEPDSNTAAPPPGNAFGSTSATA